MSARARCSPAPSRTSRSSWIDLDNLAARQQQNRLPDQLTAMWLEHVLERADDGERASA
ncbi:MAG: hypothetical protein U5K43_01805 [Halofilum sp. (in: g-proteobacteria)]|nr:hypothetical protein [Halofilum sp. (in: g-proteobacteria)]